MRLGIIMRTNIGVYCRIITVALDSYKCCADYFVHLKFCVMVTYQCLDSDMKVLIRYNGRVQRSCVLFVVMCAAKLKDRQVIR
jgi:hypothetical protein